MADIPPCGIPAWKTVRGDQAKGKFGILIRSTGLIYDVLIPGKTNYKS